MAGTVPGTYLARGDYDTCWHGEVESQSEQGEAFLIFTSRP